MLQRAVVTADRPCTVHSASTPLHRGAARQPQPAAEEEAEAREAEVEIEVEIKAEFVAVAARPGLKIRTSLPKIFRLDRKIRFRIRFRQSATANDEYHYQERNRILQSNEIQERKSSQSISRYLVWTV